MNPRIHRLHIDFQRMQELERNSPYVKIDQTTGNPPEIYVLHLTCKGIISLHNNKPDFSASHKIAVSLDKEYPRCNPHLTMITSVFHPNIYSSGIIDVGAWFPYMLLSDVIVQVIRLIRYEYFDTWSPSNRAALIWAVNNRHLFPLEDAQIVRPDTIDNVGRSFG